MKLNQNQPAIVLDFTGLENSARRALSGIVQNFLMDVGFHWQNKNFDKKPDVYLLADAIVINDSPACPVAMLFVGQDRMPSTRGKFTVGTKFFDATHELDDFFNAVEEVLPKTPADMLDILARTLSHFAAQSKEQPSGFPAPFVA